MSSSIKKASADITFTRVKAVQPTFVIQYQLPLRVTAQSVETAARHMSLATREVKTAFPRAVLKAAVRHYLGVLGSIIEFPGADPLLVQKFMGERFREHLYSSSASGFLAAAQVDTVPPGTVHLSWTSDGDVVLHGERTFKGAVAGKGFLLAIQETEDLLASLSAIYQRHADAHSAFPFSLHLTELTFSTSAERKSFPSPGEFMGLLNDLRDLKPPGYVLDFPESLVQKHIKGIEVERARSLVQKFKLSEHGFASVETIHDKLDSRGNGSSSYRVSPLPGSVTIKNEILKFFKGTYNPECGDTLNAGPEMDGTWKVHITRWSCP